MIVNWGMRVKSSKGWLPVESLEAGTDQGVQGVFEGFPCVVKSIEEVNAECVKFNLNKDRGYMWLAVDGAIAAPDFKTLAVKDILESAIDTPIYWQTRGGIVKPAKLYSATERETRVIRCYRVQFNQLPKNWSNGVVYK